MNKKGNGERKRMELQGGRDEDGYYAQKGEGGQKT
jgi:hypothetical protein